MRIALASGVLAIAALGLSAMAQVPPAAGAGTIVTYRGMCEPSGAVALPRGSFGGHFAVANDEDNILRVYAGGGGEALPVATLDLKDFLGVDAAANDDLRADLEGGAWLGDRIFWLGSHSRSAGGRLRTSRRQLFATSLRGEVGSAGVTLVPQGAPVSLLPAMRDRAGFGVAIGGDGRRQHLAPNVAGFNLEGLAAGMDGLSLVVGLRGPLLNGRATLVPIENPNEAIGGAALRTGEPLLLNLHGRGVRSLEYVESRRSYLIVAGPPTDADPGYPDGPPFRLYTWSGARGEDARPLGTADGEMRRLAEAQFTPEAMIVEASGDRIQLLSDDGDRLQAGSPCSKVPSDSSREFRSVILRLSW